MLDFLYETSELRRVFGDNFVGPNRLRHNENTLIARFISDEDSDGLDVDVFAHSLPAVFFTIVAYDTPNSIGKVNKGFRLGTGSGPGVIELTKEIVENISEGMLLLERDNKENTVAYKENMARQTDMMYKLERYERRIKELETAADHCLRYMDNDSKTLLRMVVEEHG